MVEKDLNEILADLNLYGENNDDVSISSTLLKEVTVLAKRAIKYESKLIEIRDFANMYTTENNFENVEPEMIANEVYEKAWSVLD